MKPLEMENPRGWEDKLKNSHGARIIFWNHIAMMGPLMSLKMVTFFKLNWPTVPARFYLQPGLMISGL